MSNGVEVKKLSDAAVKEIQELMGTDLVYLLAVDKQNNITPLTPQAVSAQTGQVSVDTPFKVDMTHASQISLGSATSGCCQWVLYFGTWICVRYGC